MSKPIKQKKRTLETRKRRRASKYMYCMKLCRYEDCNAYNSPMATHCHRCGRILYGPPEQPKEGLE